MYGQKGQLQKIVPEFGQDPFKELENLLEGPEEEQGQKRVDRNSGSLLLKEMYGARRETIRRKLEKRK